MHRDDFTCVHCFDDTTPLHVHHKYYVQGRKPWNYPDWALETTCAECHSALHDIEESNQFGYSEWERTVEILFNNARLADEQSENGITQ